MFETRVGARRGAVLTILCGLLVAGLAAGAGRADARAAVSRADVVDAMHQVRAAGAPSVRTLIVAPGRRERYAIGVRRLGSRARARIGDRMRVGSVTKMLTAATVVRLAEQGRLRLDDPVERVLPGVVPGGERITIAHLLGMRSGLVTYNTDPAFTAQAAADPRRHWHPLELLSFALPKPAAFAPGERFDYSNTNTIVLGLVIEAVTGRSYADAVATMVTEPLHLRRTEIPATNRLRQPRVDGYILDGDRRLDVTTWSPSWGGAAGAAISTPPDAGRFVRALLAGKVVAPRSVRTMLRRSSPMSVPGFPPGGYGLGLSWADTRCGRMYGHGGEISGYRTWVLASRDGRRSVVISASLGARPDSGLPLRFERRLTRTLEAAVCRALRR